MQTLSETQIYAAAKAGGFSSSQAVIATAIAMAESGGNPSATHRNTNGTTDYGLWQINSVHTSLFRGGAEWADPATNARMAYSVFKSQGWNAWTTYKSGAYKKETDSQLTHVLLSSHDPVPTASGSASTDTQSVNWLGNLGDAAGSLLWGDPLDAGLPPADKSNKDTQKLKKQLGVDNPLAGVNALIKAISGVFTVEFWERFGWGFLGLILVLFGIVFMVESNKTGRTLTGMAVAA